MASLFPQGSLALVAGSVLLLFAVNSYLNYRRTLQAFHRHPGRHSLLQISSVIANVLPRIPGVCFGRGWEMVAKHSLFADIGWDVITSISFYPRISAEFFVADALAVKEITMSRARFPKSIEDYDMLRFFGKNIVVTEGDEWKMHRKIAGPVFSERNNKLVWDESVRVMLDIFATWGADDAIVIDHAADITIPIALLIICVAGFGRRIPWKEDPRVPPGHRLTFHAAVHTVSTCVHVKLLAPAWAARVSPFIARVQCAFAELEMYMQEMIAERRAAPVREERADLFSALLDASEDDGGDEGATLSDRELIGNIFIFLIAGHETTAHTLCFCMGLLALAPAEQAALHRHICAVLPGGGIPSYEQMGLLTHVLAAFYETLRLFPPVHTVPKKAAEDTTIPVVRPDGSRGAVAVPRDARIRLNVTGLHYNPRYWPDPEEFRPARFLGDWPRDAFLPFSGGPRACVGRRFAETEAVAILTVLLQRYTIELRNPAAYAGLSPAARRAKLLASRQGITTTPLSVPLVFRRR